MTRKRIIKPEFWTDSTMVQLPVEARLLFIGMWNFADDFGYLDDEPERIKMLVLPSDDFDIELLIEILIVSGRLDRYEAPDGSQFLYIPHFLEHQRVEHPSKATYPDIAACKRMTITNETRREVARKYECGPGERVPVTCYYCGAPGEVYWLPSRSQRAPAWVVFPGMELDHFVARESGGESGVDNLVLACRLCNRSKKDRDGLTYSTEKLMINHEESRGLIEVPKSSPQVKLIKDKLSQPPTAANARMREAEKTPPSVAAALLALRIDGRGLDADQVPKILAKNPDLSLEDVAVWKEYLPRCTADSPIGFMVHCFDRGEKRPRMKNPKASGHINGHARPNGLAPPPPDISAEEAKRQFDAYNAEMDAAEGIAT